MSAPVTSHKLESALEGALAGGGDPATSPLYVFTPFLKLIVLGAAAGVARVTFGASVWLVILTVVMVSIMYRLVMQWITDGSGGSGLSEEEFGPWAVKTNGAITYIEYTLTFLVSVAALVTFVADRFPALNEEIFGLSLRAILGVALSVLTGWLVNRGPKTAARFFGPATLGVLVLLWLMVGATLWQHAQGMVSGAGLLVGTPVLPSFNLQAFSLAETAPGGPTYLAFTLGGFARILALMTGIEVFANLVAAYGGAPADQSRMAFGSLVIIMGTTAVTMLIVGPAIFAVSDPADPDVSVFTQTMDALLPTPVAYLGTLVGVAVLLSAAAASAEGIQNLSLGLSTRRYIPPVFGRRNRFGVADKPVWIEVAIVCVCFLAIGTSEETYLAIYAAGVFILLSMTGWAATQRLIREVGRMRWRVRPSRVLALAGSFLAAILTTVATFIIFRERFFEGAWTFLLFIPVLYTAFTYVHGHLGEPDALAERLGEIEAGALGGFGPGQQPGWPAPSPVAEVALAAPPTVRAAPARPGLDLLAWPEAPEAGARWRSDAPPLDHVVVPLDASPLAETALPMAVALTATEDGQITLVTVLPPGGASEGLADERRGYLAEVVSSLVGRHVELAVREGPVARTILSSAVDAGGDVVAIASHGRAPSTRFRIGSVSRKVVQLADLPVIVVRPSAEAGSKASLERVLVALDGSAFSERALPYARTLAHEHDAEILVLVVPEIPDAAAYGALEDLVADLRAQSEARATAYVRSVVRALHAEGLRARGFVGGDHVVATITEQAAELEAGLTMLATHGRGGLDGLLLGSVAARVVRHADGPVFVVPIRERRPG